MAKIAYADRRFRKALLPLVTEMNAIIDDYMAQGYRLTVRQMFYQLVTKNTIENSEASYKRISSIINDARLGGYMDWDAIEDRTRAFLRRQRWTSGSHMLESARDSFHMDLWKGQPLRPFFVVEKEALAGVLERVCSKWDVPILPARGYPSVTVLRDFVIEDVNPCLNAEPQQDVKIFHMGDHDPSGLDMTRDLRERVDIFTTHTVDVERVALTMKQIQEQKPPPNMAKSTDKRFKEYCRKYKTDKSWELDALSPRYLSELVDQHVAPLIDQKIWDERLKEIEFLRSRLTASMLEAKEGKW